jgi:putative Mn2+ efflux pump MntP
MGLFSIILLAAALAADAFSAAVTDGMTVKSLRLSDSLKVGLFFGGFQFIMPCVGSFLSAFASKYIEFAAPWITFVILSFLGARMIIQSNEEREIPRNPLKTSTLLLMAVATSIDALAAGVTLAAMRAPIIFSAGIIGITAFIFSFFGTLIGKRFGDLLGSKAEIAGGIVLILIGLKTLAEHLLT